VTENTNLFFFLIVLVESYRQQK